MNRFAETIKARVTTRALCERVGLKLDRHGGAVCPFHDDHDASLKVYDNPERGWHCYGCKAGSTVIDFAVRWYGITFKQAIARLNYDFSLGLPLGEKPTESELARLRAEDEARKREKRARKRAFSVAVAEWERAFERWLLLDRWARECVPKSAEMPPNTLRLAVWAYAVGELPEAKFEAMECHQRMIDACEKLRKGVSA